MRNMPEEQQRKALFKAQFSMGQYDYERFNEILKAMDEYAIKVQNFESDAFQTFYGILWELYKNFRPILFDTVREKFDKEFKDVRTKMLEELRKNNIFVIQGMQYAFDKTLIEDFDRIQMDLLEIKQIIGLGIAVDKVEELKTKLERVLGVSHE